MQAPFKLFAGSASQTLARALADSLGIPLGESTHYPLPNGEPYVELKTCVQDAKVYLIQSLITPASWHLLELVLMADAAKRSGATSVEAIIPYYSYGRQDRVTGPGQPLAARSVAQLLQASGIDTVTVLNSHSELLHSLFDIPLIELSAIPLLAHALQRLCPQEAICLLAPDAGALKLALDYSCSLPHLGQPAHILKKRENAYTVSATSFLGDVKGKDVWIVDDCIQTGQTLIQAAHLARQHGAQSISAALVHCDLSPSALEPLKALGLKYFLTSNSCENTLLQELKPTLASLAPLLQEYLTRPLA